MTGINFSAAQQCLQKVIEQLPKSAVVFDVGSKTPPQIIDILKNQCWSRDKLCLLTNQDVWRYSGSYELQHFVSLLPTSVFVLHPGYYNKKNTANFFEISWPFWYFTRLKVGNDWKVDHTKRPWGFGCLNNKYNLHRLLLGYFLSKQNLLDTMVFSQNTVDKQSLDGYHSAVLNLYSDFEDYLDQLPIRWPEPLKHHWHRSNHANDHSVNHDCYSKCYSNIVTESEVESFYHHGISVSTPVITEKSYKPLLSGQVPLYLAASGHLAHLRSLGFNVFEDLLPENFDQFGLLAKIHSLVTLVAQGKEWIENIYFDRLKEVQHNKELVYSNSVDSILVDKATHAITTWSD